MTKYSIMAPFAGGVTSRVARARSSSNGGQLSRCTVTRYFSLKKQCTSTRPSLSSLAP